MAGICFATIWNPNKLLCRGHPSILRRLHGWVVCYLTNISSKLNFFRCWTKLTHQWPVYITSALSQPLVLYHLLITGAVYLKPVTSHTQQFLSFSNHLSIHLSHHSIHIYIKQPWRHHTTLSQSDTDRKLLTQIHTYRDSLHTMYT